MTNFFFNAVQITQTLKQRLDIPIIWGGIHPTVRPEECLDYADMVCIGEGEEALMELVKKMQCGEDFHNTLGIWFKDKGKIIRNKLQPLIQDLDLIPFPDYDYRTHCILTKNSIRKIDKDLMKREMSGWCIVMPTRGCPFGCTYCCNNTFNDMYPDQKVVRKRSVENLIKELKMIKEKLPFIETFSFDDDAFFMQTKEEIMEFAESYKDKVKVPLAISGATPSTLTKEKLLPLINAGLFYVKIGIQSCSERTNRLYGRHYSTQQIEKVVKLVNEFKENIIMPQYDIILDNPWEDESDIIETLMLLSGFPPPFHLNIFSLTFYPGTELYMKAKSEGMLVSEIKDVYEKSFEHRRKTYLNRLFFLISDYANIGSRISAGMMSLLTSRKLRRIKLNWLLYFMLKILLVFKEFAYLSNETLKAIRKKEWRRIIKHIKNLFRAAIIEKAYR